jgi:leucyl aminopeptidase
MTTFKHNHKTPVQTLQTLKLKIPHKSDLAKATRTITESQALVNAMTLTKNLANCPPNICTPEYLAQAAQALAKKYPKKLRVTIFNEKKIAALKMGALMAVGQGSIHPPRLITLEYRGRRDKQAPIVFVGKGITFDTGGLSLKPATHMIGMKYDMCGAATVLGLMQFAAELKLPLNIVGLIPSAENMPDNTAYRPDDIITTLSGLTVEVLNTDAEGRLILCDALTYAERFQPQSVIDIATLTGSCSAALGKHASGVMTNHEPLSNALIHAGQISGDRCWPLPLWEEYDEALNTPIADLANIAPGSTGEAGAMIAGCFLARFTKKYHWAHLDVAGTAAVYAGRERQASGRPLPLLTQYLLGQCTHDT